MINRKSRRHRDTNPMFPFGDIMLPVIGLVALGLLIVGVKMFFLPEESRKSYEPVPEPSQTIEKQVQPVAPVTEKTETGSKGTKDQIKDPDSVIKKAPEPVVQVKPVAQNNDRTETQRTGEDQNGNAGKEAVIAKPVKEEGSVSSPKVTDDNVGDPQSKPSPTATWGVQIGSFGSRSSADSVAGKASSSGYQVKITEAMVNGKKFHRVTVMAGDTRDSALKLEKKLQKEGYPTFVTPVK